MSFTYDSDDLADPMNRLRFMIQDTVDAGHLFEDAEVKFASEQSTNIYRVAADLCRAAAAKFAAMPGHEGEIVLATEDKSRVYMALAAKYDEKASEQDGSLTNTGSAGISMPTISSCGPSFKRDTQMH